MGGKGDNVRIDNKFENDKLHEDLGRMGFILCVDYDPLNYGHYAVVSCPITNAYVRFHVDGLSHLTADTIPGVDDLVKSRDEKMQAFPGGQAYCDLVKSQPSAPLTLAQINTIGAPLGFSVELLPPLPKTEGEDFYRITDAPLGIGWDARMSKRTNVARWAYQFWTLNAHRVTMEKQKAKIEAAA